jgi:hypothetical protein
VFVIIVIQARARVESYIDQTFIMDEMMSKLAMSAYCCGLAYANSSVIATAVPFGAFGGIDTLRLMGFVEPDVDLPVSGHVVNSTYEVTRAAKLSMLRMTALLYQDITRAPSGADVLMNFKVKYLRPATLQTADLAGRAVLGEALDQCALGALTSRNGGDANLSSAGFLEGSLNLAGALEYSVALRGGFVNDGRIMFRGYRTEFHTIGIVMPAIFDGLFLAAIIHCLWRYYRDFNRMLDVLRGVKPELIEKSLYPRGPGSPSRVPHFHVETSLLLSDVQISLTNDQDSLIARKLRSLLAISRDLHVPSNFLAFAACVEQVAHSIKQPDAMHLHFAIEAARRSGAAAIPRSRSRFRILRSMASTRRSRFRGSSIRF